MTIKVTISVTDGADRVMMKVLEGVDRVENVAESRILGCGECHSVYVWQGRKIEIEEVKNEPGN